MRANRYDLHDKQHYFNAESKKDKSLFKQIGKNSSGHKFSTGTKTGPLQKIKDFIFDFLKKIQNSSSENSTKFSNLKNKLSKLMVRLKSNFNDNVSRTEKQTAQQKTTSVQRTIFALNEWKKRTPSSFDRPPSAATAPTPTAPQKPLPKVPAEQAQKRVFPSKPLPEPPTQSYTSPSQLAALGRNESQAGPTPPPRPAETPIVPPRPAVTPPTLPPRTAAPPLPPRPAQPPPPPPAAPPPPPPRPAPSPPPPPAPPPPPPPPARAAVRRPVNKNLANDLELRNKALRGEDASGVDNEKVQEEKQKAQNEQAEQTNLLRQNEMNAKKAEQKELAPKPTEEQLGGRNELLDQIRKGTTLKKTEGKPVQNQPSAQKETSVEEDMITNMQAFLNNPRRAPQKPPEEADKTAGAEDDDDDWT